MLILKISYVDFFLLSNLKLIFSKDRLYHGFAYYHNFRNARPPRDNRASAVELFIIKHIVANIGWRVRMYLADNSVARRLISSPVHKNDPEWNLLIFSHIRFSLPCRRPVLRAFSTWHTNRKMFLSDIVQHTSPRTCIAIYWNGFIKVNTDFSKYNMFNIKTCAAYKNIFKCTNMNHKNKYKNPKMDKNKNINTLPYQTLNEWINTLISVIKWMRGWYILHFKINPLQLSMFSLINGDECNFFLLGHHFYAIVSFF